ncbi:MAG: hypothetical protein DME59_06140 [Verrucomicrobia bacterium]|nr:MAG: hypothetical protein DME59_06140 [Verrucomicrobiota bacterium]PYL77292.1 MAG: hypothetical protein DMF26_04620 [Verrucomicrobiota bacterium]
MFLHRTKKRLYRKVDFLFDQIRRRFVDGCARVRRVAIVWRHQHRQTPVEAAVSAANEEMQATRLPPQSKRKAATRFKA